MSDEVEVAVPIAPAEGISEVLTVDRDNEIVYLYCTLKNPEVSSGPDGKPFDTEVVKAGEHAFKMKAGQVAKMKRVVAEWHVAKTSSFDAIHFHLKLEVKTEKEMAEIKALLEAQAKVRAAQAKVKADAEAKAKADSDAQALADAAKLDAEAKAKAKADA